MYETRVPTGVDALKIARCFLHSATGREVESSDVVSASAVGAISDIHRQKRWEHRVGILRTFVDDESKEDDDGQSGRDDRLAHRGVCA